MKHQHEAVIGQSVAQQLSHQYVGLAEGLLDQALQRPHTEDELSEFCYMSSALLCGSMYTMIREVKGPKEAESWLRKTLAMTASVVRLRGSDAMLKFDFEVKDVPNIKGRRQPVKAEEQLRKDLEPPSPPCACPKDAEGRCEECAVKLSMMLRGTFETIRKMSEFAKERKAEKATVCKACDTEQMDYAISKLVPDVLVMGSHLQGQEAELFGQEMMGALYQLGLMAGVREMPFTEKAWQEAVKTAGKK